MPVIARITTEDFANNDQFIVHTALKLLSREENNFPTYEPRTIPSNFGKPPDRLKF